MSLPSVVVAVGELALLLILLLLLELLLLAVRAGDGEVLLGEAGVTSPSATLSVAFAPRGSGAASSVGDAGEPGSVTGREELRGGEDSREFDCC